MYRAFFGLRETPFDLTPNPHFLFLSPRHREALSNLRYGLGARKGVTLLLGQPGTGKTTIMRAFLASTAANAARFVYVENPALTREEFYELLAKRLGFTRAAAESKAEFLLELEAAVTATTGPESRLVLILDEAQALPPDLLEEVRLLSNIETESEKLVSLVLAGQPELAERLEEPRFEALKQRVALRCELVPFDLAETAAYIGGRLRIAGGEPGRIFTRDAVTAIYEASHGIPRTISIICDNALVGGFAADQRPVGRDIVLEVCRDFRLRAETQAQDPFEAPLDLPSERALRASMPPARETNVGQASRLSGPGTAAHQPGVGQAPRLSGPGTVAHQPGVGQASRLSGPGTVAQQPGVGQASRLSDPGTGRAAGPPMAAVPETGVGQASRLSGPAASAHQPGVGQASRLSGPAAGHSAPSHQAPATGNPWVPAAAAHAAAPGAPGRTVAPVSARTSPAAGTVAPGLAAPRSHDAAGEPNDDAPRGGFLSRMSKLLPRRSPALTLRDKG